MSGTTIKSKRIIGFAATAAVALTMVASGGAHAAGADKDAFQQSARDAHAASKASIGGFALSSARVASSAATAVATESACTIKGYAPNKLVLGANAVRSTFKITTSGCELNDWFVALYPFIDSDTGDRGWAEKAVPKATLDPHLLTNDMAGKQTGAVEVGAQATDGTVTYNDDLALTLLRASAFPTFDASEPVKKGKNITIKATFGRINWNGAKHLKNTPYVGGKAQLQFKADGTSAYKTVKTVTAVAGGKLSTTVKASKTGRWRFYFPGISTTGTSVSARDAVKVTS
jgi:hypothetical protein